MKVPLAHKARPFVVETEARSRPHISERAPLPRLFSSEESRTRLAATKPLTKVPLAHTPGHSSVDRRRASNLPT
eukprot:3760221-Heterocapsa_arctica.AAC.1